MSNNTIPKSKTINPIVFTLEQCCSIINFLFEILVIIYILQYTYYLHLYIPLSLALLYQSKNILLKHAYMIYIYYINTTINTTNIY